MIERAASYCQPVTTFCLIDAALTKSTLVPESGMAAEIPCPVAETSENRANALHTLASASQPGKAR